MIKLLILSAIVILSALLGIILTADKKKTMKVFAQFYEFNEKLLLNLKYGRIKVGEIASEYEYVQSVLQGKSLLKGEENEFLQSYISNIGATDAYSQVDYLNERKQSLKKYKDDSEAAYKKYGSLYFKIALMIGILVAVLLA